MQPRDEVATVQRLFGCAATITTAAATIGLRDAVAVFRLGREGGVGCGRVGARDGAVAIPHADGAVGSGGRDLRALH